MSEHARARLTCADLESHERFVRAMVRQLVRDEASLDDVIQETWIRALAARPRQLRALRAWLTRIARRVALNQRRSESRRRARERAVARPEAVDAGAAARRDALRHLLVRAVLRLPEPYRSTVIDRYYHGRSAVFIAGREGVTAGAVRKRLRRATVLLRADLGCRLRSGPLVLVACVPDRRAPVHSILARVRLALDASTQWIASFAVHAAAAGLMLLAARPEPTAPAAPAFRRVGLRAEADPTPLDRARGAHLAEAPWPERASDPAPDAPVVPDPAPDDMPAPEATPGFPARDAAVGVGGRRGGGGGRGGGGLRPERPAPEEPAPVIRRGLDWLVRHQDGDGRWDLDGFPKHDPVEDPFGPGGAARRARPRGVGLCRHDEGGTALAVLALLDAGYDGQGRRGSARVAARQRAVRRGLRFLQRRQRADGAIGHAARRMMYHHAIATLALARAYAATDDPGYGRAARCALRFLLDTRARDGGWRYGPGAAAGDLSVTAWVALALDAARRAGLEVSPSVRSSLRDWIAARTDFTGRAGYRTPGGPSAKPEGRPVGAGWHLPTLSAAAVVARRRLGARVSASRLAEGRRLCAAAPPDPRAVNRLYWYFGARALATDGGAAWDRWRAAAQETLLEGQRRDDGPDHGSWDPEGPWGPDGGRVYATALALMTLAVTGTDGDASGPSGPADAVVLTSAGR